MKVLEDRRRKRSTDPLVAVHYQLAHARHDGELEAIVVADAAGVVVAGAGSWAVCEELAAYAPLLAQGVWSEPGVAGESRLAQLRTEVTVRAVEVEGQEVLVCARGGFSSRATTLASLGPAGDTRSAVIKRAAEGIARILKAA
jgi:hypothetical protein